MTTRIFFADSAAPEGRCRILPLRKKHDIVNFVNFTLSSPSRGSA